MAFGIVFGVSVGSAFLCGLAAAASCYVAFKCIKKCFCCFCKKKEKVDNSDLVGKFLRSDPWFEGNRPPIPEMSPEKPVVLDPPSPFKYEGHRSIGAFLNFKRWNSRKKEEEPIPIRKLIL